MRFRRGYVRQGRDVKDLPYKTSLYPYGSIFVAVFPILILLAQGYGSFYPQWDPVAFVASYIGVIPFVLPYILHKIITKSKVVPLEEIGTIFIYVYK
jgi:lysine-specific permease